LPIESAAVPRSNSLAVLIGDNIVRARGLADGMTQGGLLRGQAAVLAKGERPFTREQLSSWENGHVRASDRYLIRIGRITGQPLSFFFESHVDREV
jgi:transcriptional regulator with XRE-family HTH domain